MPHLPSCLRRVLLFCSGTHPAEVADLPPGERLRQCIFGLSLVVPVAAFLVGSVRASVAQTGGVPLAEVGNMACFASIIFM